MGCQSCCVPGPQRVPSHHVLAAVELMGLSPHHGLVSYSSLLLGTSWKSIARGRSRGKEEVSWGEWREAHGGAASLGTRNLYSPSRSLPLSCSLGLPGCWQHGHLGHLGHFPASSQAWVTLPQQALALSVCFRDMCKWLDTSSPPRRARRAVVSLACLCGRAT